jgi:hypothetical protein
LISVHIHCVVFLTVQHNSSSKPKVKANLQARLKEEAIANAERDLAIAAAWFPLEEEAGRLAETSRSGKPLANVHDVSSAE